MTRERDDARPSHGSGASSFTARNGWDEDTAGFYRVVDPHLFPRVRERVHAAQRSIAVGSAKRVLRVCDDVTTDTGATFCASHHRAPLLCPDCLGEHVAGHSLRIETTCDQCREVDEDGVYGLAVVLPKAVVHVRRGDDRFVAPLSIVIGALGVCGACMTYFSTPLEDRIGPAPGTIDAAEIRSRFDNMVFDLIAEELDPS